MFKRLNIFKWIGWLFAPIEKNGAFFVFMFALGWLCTQTELMPYYLRNRGAKPYELSAPELFLDIYVLCVILTLLRPLYARSSRFFTLHFSVFTILKSLLYLLLYGVALVDMFCYERFESTLTPTMLMLVGETNGQEASEFLSTYLNGDILTTGVGWILLLMLAHLMWTLLRRFLAKKRRQMILPKVNPAYVTGLRAILGCLVAWLLYGAVTQTWDNKQAMQRLFSYHSIGQVEHEMTLKNHAHLYVPVYRLAFGIYANRLASHQIIQLEAASQKVCVDSCSFRVPNIVLVIGESYNRHHSQLYGYDKPTTPHQKALAEEGSLIPFSDVVSTWNLTSFVFKHLFSLYAVGDSGEWCDQPLFPEVFRKAGYHVTFLTNQFLPQAKEAVYDFSGGFFLNHPKVSSRLFDTRNTQLYRYDGDLLQQRDGSFVTSAAVTKEPSPCYMTIIHLMGSHVDYRARYPQKTNTYFKPQMYNRPELTAKQRQTLADYDNSLRYNDSILAAITQRFTDKDALVIYMPDHGEEIFDNKPYVSGRRHNADIDYQLARNEMEIPFWVCGSPQYIENHPYGWQALKDAKDRPLMVDALPHLLLYLGGISTPLYRSELNVISPDYNTHRPRILKGTTDYNQLKK